MNTNRVLNGLLFTYWNANIRSLRMRNLEVLISAGAVFIAYLIIQAVP